MISAEKKGASIAFAHLSQLLGGAGLRAIYLVKRVALWFKSMDRT